MKKVISLCLVVCLCFANVQFGVAESLSGLFGNIGSMFEQTENDEKNAAEGLLENAGAILGGLFAADTGIPKKIHYDDFELFKQDIDALEKYFQAYADFMKKYDASDLSMLADYTELMAKYADAMRVLDSLDESKMTKQERDYYTKVLLRINKILYSLL